MEKLLRLCVAALLTFSISQGYAQEDNSQRKSPPDTVSGKVGNSTEITIAYSRPSVKGRTVWGELVPYNQIWRTGANEATVFSTSADVIVEGQMLEMGNYSLFTIPGKEEWVIIFNFEPEQWGAYKYNAAEDALRVKVKPVKGDQMVEKMTFEIEESNDRQSVIYLKWEKVVIPIKLREKVF